MFGPVFEVPIADGAPELAYIIHRGDEKDPGPDQFLWFDSWGYEVWQLKARTRPTPGTALRPPDHRLGRRPGNIDEQRAHWVSRGHHRLGGRR